MRAYVILLSYAHRRDVYAAIFTTLKRKIFRHGTLIKDDITEFFI